MGAPDLDVLIDKADDRNRRRAAITAAEWASIRANLSGPEIERATRLWDEGRFGDSPERLGLEALARSLDEAQWSYEETLEEAGVPWDQRDQQMFNRARAAFAAYWASAADAREAASEAIYESMAIVDDVDEVRRVVAPVLGENLG